jgi:CHASE1-domain containing sensor protein/signal transduction histidine kinase
MQKLLQNKFFNLLPPAALVIGLVFSVIAYLIASNFQSQREDLYLQNEVGQISSKVKERFHDSQQILVSTAAFWDASDNVSRNEWRVFVKGQDLRANYPGIQGMGFAEVVRPNELEAHVQKIRAQGFPNYEIKPAGVRDFYTSIIYLEPFDERNQKAFGYDMFSQSVMREAMQMAVDTGQPTMSGKVGLIQENAADGQAGFLIYVPVYKKESQIRTKEERMANLQGFIYATFRAKNFIGDIMGRDTDDVGFRIYEGKTKDPAALMFDSHPNCQKKVVKSKEITIAVNNRFRTLEFRAHKEFFSKIESFLSLIVLLGGIVTSVLLYTLMLSIVRTRILALKQAEDMTLELKEAENRYRTLVTQLQTGVLIQTPASEIVLSNQSALGLLGLSEEQLLGKTSFDPDWNVIHEDGSPFPGSTHPVPVAIATRAPVKNVVMGVYHPPTKEVVWLLVNADPELNADGSVKEVVCTFVDITERKKMEEKLQREHEALIQSSKMAELGSMLGAIIHQWKQPLNVMAIMVQDIKYNFGSGELNEQTIDDFIRSMMETINFMSKTADNFRDFYKPSKERGAFSILDQTDSVLKLLEKQLKFNSIGLLVEGDRTICAMGCTGEFKQVVLNIINNAVEVLKEKNIKDARIVVNVFKEDEKAVLSITDNAGGIPSELLPDKLFEAFTSTKGDNGTGIGLSLSRTIIEENMQGHLNAKNTDKGACFMIELPIAQHEVL